MKTFITVSALALVSNIAMADVFEYEQQFGSQDLDPNVSSETRHISDPVISNASTRISLDTWYRGNPDVENVDYQHDGVNNGLKGDQFTSYDLFIRGNPDLDV